MESKQAHAIHNAILRQKKLVERNRRKSPPAKELTDDERFLNTVGRQIRMGKELTARQSTRLLNIYKNEVPQV